jgi:hypothetical protein
MMPRTAAALLLLLSTLHAGHAPGQESQEDPWYRVELLVFRQAAPANNQEYWPPEPALGYPPTQRFLVYPDRVAQRAAAHPEGSSELDAFGRQTITLPDPTAEPAPDIPRPGASTETELPTGPGALPGDAAGAELSLPRPFEVRAASEREFAAGAAYMQRRGGNRVLFHETWLQPLPGGPQAVPLILDDSGAEQRYPALQGSVRLYRQRYLHIDTRLWLNTAGAYLPGEWRMPAPPLGPASLVIEAPVAPTIDAAPGFSAGAIPAAGDLASAPPAFPPRGEGYGSRASASAGEDRENGEDSQDGAPVYPYRHAVLLEASRRMRDGETHYLDHPLLGVVVKLTPLSEEDLAALAAPAEEVARDAPQDDA